MSTTRNVLLIGGGGREHALAWKIAQSTRLKRLYCVPGNVGMEDLGEKVVVEPAISGDDVPAVVRYAKDQAIDLAIVGPEDPLCLGLVDELQTAGIRAFGPTKDGARLEGDKTFAKELMQSRSIPTADTRIFSMYNDAKRYIDSRDSAMVVKAAGLAKGKGAIVCEDPDEAQEALHRIMMKREFGDAGDQVLVEERLTGPEVSVLAFVDRNSIYILELSQDHKPIGEGDTGPNTGGMGAYSPMTMIDDTMLRHIEAEVLVPIVDAMRSQGITYRGVLYAGLMLTAGGPKVLEFNCRFGDPEAQPLLMRLRTDIIDVVEAVIDDKLDDITLEWDARAAVCVVMASGGYPGPYEKGKPITGLAEANAVAETVVFHAGTTGMGHQVVTNGGRVLGVTSLGTTLEEAAARAYEAADMIHFEGAYYRRDIGAKAMKKG